ncbi:DUF4440 domain-containing protein [Microbulbifer harenosus]|uniref:Nuclear transport factor 2 family protein n=1 Tax=Microbulbifer harenosus TaxID=2576840 RepID=A0ABY2ULL7_9GAMM|nr:DUF4440 domain-containing protein [Microbulbifer harenosus]TLM76689.1 nuclear transport factor 2 family protein [Microbulbifer harenosus]
MNIREEIIKMEKALLDPEVRRSAKKVRQFLSADFREVGASGTCFGLKEVIQSISSQTDWVAIPDLWEFRQLSDDVAQLMYRVKIVRGEAGEVAHSQRSSIWRKEVDTWKLVYHQGTMVGLLESKP